MKGHRLFDMISKKEDTVILVVFIEVVVILIYFEEKEIVWSTRMWNFLIYPSARLFLRLNLLVHTGRNCNVLFLTFAAGHVNQQ